MQEDLKLDGNAVAGVLGEVFALEVTAAQATCAGCAAINPIGRVDAYVNAPGAVLRCPSCGQVVMRLVRGPGRYWLDLSGTRCLELRAAGG